jgi:hypothetical protein
MGYNALVTLDLKKATDDERLTFNNVLIGENWTKIKSLTTAWKILFNDHATREFAIEALKSDLKKAKEKSKIKKVEFAIQLDKSDLIISYL